MKSKKENSVNVKKGKEAGIAVSLSDNFLYNIINLTGDPIFVKDVESKFVIANDALCDVLGMKREDILGKTLGESLPEDQMDLFLQNDRMVLASGKESISEEPLTGKDGKILTVITKKTRYIDENGNKFLIANMHDITERKKIEDDLMAKTQQAVELNNTMIGREIKMIELKKEIESLQKEIEDLKKNK